MEAHVGGGATGLREQQRGEKLLALLGATPILHPQPAVVGRSGGLAAIGITSGGFDVVAERLPGAAQRIDVAGCDIREPRDEGG